MFGFGRVEELLIILVIILVLFGGRKIPELSKAIGESIKDIRRGFRDEQDTAKNSGKETETSSEGRSA